MLSDVLPTAGDHLSSDGARFFDTPQETLFLSTPPEPVFSFSGSDEGDQNPQEVEVVDERKRRRMISNRESARRSRMRKQKHLENLRNQLNRLKTDNRELTNRLRLVNLHGKLVREENQRLLSESVMLQQKLWDIRQVLLVHQLLPSSWPCNNNVTSIYEQNQNPPSLIT